jgi:hypothetical protein
MCLMVIDFLCKSLGTPPKDADTILQEPTRGILTLAKSRWKHGELTKPGNGAHGNQRKQQESHKVLLNSIDKATET